MFHITSAHRIVTCEYSCCPLPHYTTKEEANKAIEVEIAKIFDFNKSLKQLETHSKAKTKINEEVYHLSETLTKKARAYGFFVSSYRFQKDLEEAAAQAVNAGHKDFLTLYEKFLEKTVKQIAIEKEYKGWAEYFKYDNSPIIHYSEHCKKNSYMSYKRDSFNKIVPKLAGRPYQSFASQNIPLCGFCFPFIKAKTKPKASKTKCPNSGSVRFELLYDEYNFSTNIGSCDECKSEINVTKKGVLRTHFYPAKPVTITHVKILENKDFVYPWRLLREDRNNVLYWEIKGEYYKEYVNEKIVKEIKENKTLATELINFYTSLFTENVFFKINLSNFSGFTKINQEQIASCSRMTNVFEKAECLVFSIKYPTETIETIQRLIKTKSIGAVNYEDFGYSALTAVNSSRHATIDEKLDLLDFAFNGFKYETFKEFREINTGRVFPVREVYGPQKTREDDLNLTLRNIYILSNRFYQLSKRSQKLKKRLETITLEELLRVLNQDIPGWLLVKDTLAIIESLRKPRIIPAFSTTYNNYGSKGIARKYGIAIAKALEDNNKIVEFTKYVQSEKFICDGVYTDTDSFVIHAFEEIGIEKFLEIMEVVYHETDGITARGFNRIVSQGGFIEKDMPPAWEIIVTNW